MANSSPAIAAINQITQRCDYWEQDENLYQGVEAEVGLLVPNLLLTLDIPQQNICPEYKCSNGKRVDFAARFEGLKSSSSFSKPDLVVEVKKPSIVFSNGSKRYAEVAAQLQEYLRDRKCNSVSYGIIFNGCQLQLFRKHGLLSYPISPILSVNSKNIKDTINYLQKTVKKSDKLRGTIITVWNNKGGVGKTTIAQSLAILLSERRGYQRVEKNRILLIDFDHNQGDLTTNCKMERSNGLTKELLDNDYLGKLTEENIRKSFKVFTNIPSTGRKPRFPFEIKLLTADAELSKLGSEYRKVFASEDRFPLRQLCMRLSEEFDYIIIDSPPNYEQSVFSKEAVSAADCILPIALYQNNNSIRNYAKAVLDQINPLQKLRYDGGPFSLGIWFNRWRSTWTATYTRSSVKNQIKNTEREEDQVELKRIFYKNKSRELRKIVETADIARSIMDEKGLPGVVRFIRARSAFDLLLNEFTD